MKENRYKELMNDTALNLTQSECDEGWHFCKSEWDGALIHTSWQTMYSACNCFTDEFKIQYKNETEHLGGEAAKE